MSSEIEVVMAAVVEYRYVYPHRKTVDTAREILRQAGAFPRANAECEQRRGNGDILAAAPSNLKDIYTDYPKLLI
jgi:hypothetical protein